jgi:hypothetical protein
VIGSRPYSLRSILSVAFGFRTLSLTRFVEKIRVIFVSSNKFIKKLDSRIFLMILIMYHKY